MCMQIYFLMLLVNTFMRQNSDKQRDQQNLKNKNLKNVFRKTSKPVLLQHLISLKKVSLILFKQKKSFFIFTN